MKKRLVVMLLACAMVLGLGIYAYAAEEAPGGSGLTSTITVSSVEATRDGTVKVTLDIADNPGIVSGGIKLTYGEGLTATGGTSTLPNGQVNTNENGVIHISFGGSENYTENGTIATIDFSVSNTATCGEKAITAEIGQGSNGPDFITHLGDDYSGVTVDTTFVPGAVTVAHTIDQTVAAKDATCVAAGNPAYTHCSACSKFFYEENGAATEADAAPTIAATGVHTYGEFVVTKAATCQAAGSQTKTCEVCSNEVTEEIPIDPDAHTYSGTGGTVVQVADCTNEGITRTTCTTCGANFDAKTPALGHDGTKTEAKATTVLTRADNGTETVVKGCIEHWKCSRCAKYFDSDPAGEGANEIEESAAIFACTMPGDADGNNKVTSFDATRILLYTSKKVSSMAGAANADSDGNGSITSFDATRILLYTSKKVNTITNKPAPVA